MLRASSFVEGLVSPKRLFKESRHWAAFLTTHMNIALHIAKGFGAEWIFRVIFENGSSAPLPLPLDVIKRNGARLGLHFSFAGNDLEPVDVVLVSPRRVAEEVPVAPGGNVSIDFVGAVERKSEDVCALVFEGASYKIVPGGSYNVQFIWHDMRSNVIDWKIL